MRLKTIKDEVFGDYKLPSMLIATSYCDFKCCKEQGLPHSVCQNESWSHSLIKDIPNEQIVERYLSNPFSSAIAFGGLEPFLQFDELLSLVQSLRERTEDDVVIYTGYYPNEIESELLKLKQFPNIIVKFGRYIPNQQPHFDKVLGANLASDNQWAEKIS